MSRNCILSSGTFLSHLVYTEVEKWHIFDEVMTKTWWHTFWLTMYIKSTIPPCVIIIMLSVLVHRNLVSDGYFSVAQMSILFLSVLCLVISHWFKKSAKMQSSGNYCDWNQVILVINRDRLRWFGHVESRRCCWLGQTIWRRRLMELDRGVARERLGGIVSRRIQRWPVSRVKAVPSLVTLHDPLPTIFYLQPWPCHFTVL